MEKKRNLETDGVEVDGRLPQVPDRAAGRLHIQNLHVAIILV
jgi:hypothetical protein